VRDAALGDCCADDFPAVPALLLTWVRKLRAVNARNEKQR